MGTGSPLANSASKLRRASSAPDHVRVFADWRCCLPLYVQRRCFLQRHFRNVSSSRYSQSRECRTNMVMLGISTVLPPPFPREALGGLSQIKHKINGLYVSYCRQSMIFGG